MTRGAYVVAFGDPARACAVRLITSIRKHMPGLPVCLVGAEPLGREDIFVEAPDADVGGRRAKLGIYDLAPAEWEAVLYLDADTELVDSVEPLFRWVESGWDFVICRDVGDSIHSFQRKNNIEEFRATLRAVGSLWAMQFNGGVWTFHRCAAMERFFGRWREEYEVHLQRDQGALIRALWAEPVRLLLLGHEWNNFPKYTKLTERPAINHYPEDARRWRGKLPGRIDDEKAWQIVRQFEARQVQR